MKIKFHLSDYRKEETMLLKRAWSCFDRQRLRNYLVEGDQDPRINLESILTRHFLISGLFPGQFQELMSQEIKFGNEMNIKWFENRYSSEEEKDRYELIWAKELTGKTAARVSVLEPACGSANDYRYLVRYGIAGFIDYRGFDLTENNIKNAREMFPDARFDIDNLLNIQLCDGLYDYIVIFDLFEHLSLDGLSRGLSEVCRMAKKGIAISFFNMSERERHKVNPVGYYHWNELSAPLIKKFFIENKFSVRIIKISDLLDKGFIPVREKIPAWEQKQKSYSFFMEKMI